MDTDCGVIELVSEAIPLNRIMELDKTFTDAHLKNLVASSVTEIVFANQRKVHRQKGHFCHSVKV